jgi:hypothetical protein
MCFWQKIFFGWTQRKRHHLVLWLDSKEKALSCALLSHIPVPVATIGVSVHLSQYIVSSAHVVYFHLAKFWGRPTPAIQIHGGGVARLTYLTKNIYPTQLNIIYLRHVYKTIQQLLFFELSVFTSFG